MKHILIPTIESEKNITIIFLFFSMML